MNATLDQMRAALNNPAGSPFLLENDAEYLAWRAIKLRSRQDLSPTRLFRLDADGLLPAAQHEAAARQLGAYNFILFESAGELDKARFLALNRQFGLDRLDANPGADLEGVTSLRVVDADDERAHYIPYTNRALNWHTDGYYNSRERRISAFALYCVRPASRGGGNFLLDHEWLYMLIRDQAPELIEALMCDDMLRIPPNVQGNRVIRAEESGPVFAPTQSGLLAMRYTSRPRNILWKSDRRSERALNLIREILMDGEAIVEARLQARQGLICNNILHGRQAFHDRAGQPGRLLYRARYRDAVDLCLSSVPVN